MNGSKLFASAGLVLLVTAGSVGGAFLVEQTLTSEANQTLAQAGVDAKISFSGRDVRITAEGEQLDKAVALLAELGLVAGITTTSNTPSQTPTASVAESVLPTQTTPVPPQTPSPSPTGTPELVGPTTPAQPPVTTPEPMPRIIIQFSGGLANISPEQAPKIATMATWLKANPSVVVEVVGHTDNGRDSTFREQLAGKRAKNVIEALVSSGVDREQLVFATKAAAEPVAPNTSAEGRAENRRVTFAPKGER